MKNMGNAKSIFVIDDDVNIGNMLEEALIKKATRFSAPIQERRLCLF